jgi:hypothetical protein
VAFVEDLVQEVVVAGGSCCFWVGPSRSNSQLFAIGLNGTVPQAANNGAAVSLVITAELCRLKLKVTTDDASGRLTNVSCKQSSVDLSAVSDQSPYALKGAMGDYAPRIHNHNDLYSQLGHNHDGSYSGLGHNHDGSYSGLGHNHDGSYSGLGHNHDGSYSGLGHGHDGSYSGLGHNHNHNLLTNRLPREHTLAFETRLVRQVPQGVPLQELIATSPEFNSLLTELGGLPLAAYVARNGISSVSAMVTEFGVVTRVLAGILVRNETAPDLRWNLRVFYTSTEAQYSRPSGISTEDLHLFVTTHLNAP